MKYLCNAASVLRYRPLIRLNLILIPRMYYSRRLSIPVKRKIPTCARLPIELYRPIINYISSTQDLASLARVCKAIQAEAERHLYREIVLHPIAFPRLCYAILKYDRLACLVKKCEIYVQLHLRNTSFHEQSQSKDDDNIIRISCSLIARLSRFSHLKELHVQSLVSGTDSKLGRALSACKLCLLKFCSSCPLDEDMLTFLDTQTHIREVIILNSRVYLPDSRNHQTHPQRTQSPTLRMTPRISTASVLISNPTSANPDLTTLKVLTPHAAVSVVPGRSITRIEVLVWDGNCVRSVAAAIGRSKSPLRSLLVAHGLRLDPGDLSALGQHLPELRYLGECSSDTVSSFVQWSPGHSIRPNDLLISSCQYMSMKYTTYLV